MKIIYTKLLFLLLLSFLIGSCKTIQIERPIKAIAPIAKPEVPTSTIPLPIEILSSDLSAQIISAMPSPLVQGQTEELGLKLLAKEKEAEDRTLWDNIKDPIVSWIAKAIPFRAQLDYEVEMLGFDLEFVGDSVFIEAQISTKTDLVTKNSLPFLDKYTRVEGKYDCPSEAIVRLSGVISMTSEASLKIDLDQDNASLSFTRLCSNQALSGFNTPELFKPLFSPIQEKIRLTTSRILTKQLQAALEDNQDQLSFKAQLDDASRQLATPYLLQDSVWLITDLQEMFITPFEGKGEADSNRLCFAVGVHAKPQVIFTGEKPDIKTKETVDFAIKEIDNKANIYVHAKYPLKDAARQMRDYLKPYIDQNYPQYGSTIGTVDLYAHHQQVVVEIELLKSSTNKHKAMLYLKGTPLYDAKKQEVFLDDLHFTAKTKDMVLQFAKFIAQPQVIKQLKANARFEASQQLKDLQKQLNDFNYETELGILSGNFDYLDVQAIFVSEKDFELFLQAKGLFRFDWKKTENE